MLARAVALALAPVRCGGCGDALVRAAAGAPATAWCAHCAVRRGAPAGPWPTEPGAGGCPGWAAAAYRGPVRRAVLAAKAGAPAAIAELLAERLPAHALPAGAQVTWIPGHPLRTVHAPDAGRVLAATVAGAGPGLIVTPLLRRSALGRRQAHRSPEARRAAVERLGLRVARPPGPVVVLVDDVRTTGATLDHAAALLRAAGAREVSAIVVASALGGAVAARP